MRLVVDTNILISALLNRRSPARHLLDAWEERRFELLICEQQLEEYSLVSRYPKIRNRITPALAGSLKNRLRDVAVVVEIHQPPSVARDPNDDWMLALADAGKADYIVSGDKRHVLELKRHGKTKIVTLTKMIQVLR